MKYAFILALATISSANAFADYISVDDLSFQQRIVVFGAANSIAELQNEGGMATEYPKQSDIKVLSIHGDRIDAQVKLNGLKFAYTVSMRSHGIVNGSLDVISE